MGDKLSAFSKKITLIEIDLNREQSFWTNWCAGVWYVDFDAVYDRVDPSLIAGVYAQPGIVIGSVKEGSTQLTSVASVSTVQSTNSSYYWDGTERRLYIHLDNGEEPLAGLYVRIGVTQGVSNHAGYYNGLYYEPRISALPVFSKTKDPLYFGRISVDSAQFSIDNADGVYDTIGEDEAALWGAPVRILQGFDDDLYGAFIRLSSGFIDGVRVGATSVSFTTIDNRAGLSRSVPVNDFDATTYPNIDPKYVGKPIPLVYGIVKSMVATCTNDLESSPASYAFKIADTAGAGHSIKSIDAVYVNGVVVTPSATSLANGTFNLAVADYNPRDVVTVDLIGFEDGGDAIISPADIIVDLLDTWLGLAYTSANYDTTEWAATKADVDDAYPDGAGIVIDKAREVFSIVEQLCASFLLNMIPKDNGQFTLRMYDPARAVSQTFAVDELLEVPTLSYDTSQVISSIAVRHSKRWSVDEYDRLHDTSREAESFGMYGRYREEEFDTLLTTATDAQTFADAMQDLQGRTIKTFDVPFKMQPFELEIMDFVSVDLSRPSKAMLGVVTAEVIGKRVTASTGVVLTCRMV